MTEHQTRVSASSAVAAALASGMAASLASVGPATAQDGPLNYGSGFGSLPAYGAGTRVGDLRPQLERLLPRSLPSTAQQRPWVIVPSIGVDVGLTDNARRASSPREVDAFTQISPGVFVSGDTARVRANLSYTPIAELYASTPSQNRLDHYLNAGAQVTVVPNVFFVDLRGNVSQQSRTGGFGQSAFAQGTPSAFDRDDQVQTASVQVTPSLVQRFGGFGTAQLLYSLSYTTQSDRSDNRRFVPPLGSNFNSTGSANNFNGQNQVFFPQGSLLTHREQATFATGENFGRIRNLALLEGVQFDGGGIYRGAYRNQASIDNAFAINRSVAVLGLIGYQDLKYNTIPPYRVNGILWNAGVRLTGADPENFLEARYGRKDGFDAQSLDASYAPTARIRLFARYSTGVTTDAEDQQNRLSSTSVDAFGGSVDAITGAPVASTGGFFGTQNNLFRLRRASITGVYVLTRDSISVSVVNEDRSPVSNAVAANSAINSSLLGVQNDTSNGTYGTISWQRDIRPDLRSNVALQYGTRSSDLGVNSSEQTLSASIGATYQISETLTSRATYVFNQRSGAGQGREFYENFLLVGLRKSF